MFKSCLRVEDNFPCQETRKLACQQSDMIGIGSELKNCVEKLDASEMIQKQNMP